MKNCDLKITSVVVLAVLCSVLIIFTGCTSSATAITSSPATTTVSTTTSASASSVTLTGSPATETKQPIEVVSIKESTSQPVNPGGPVIEIVVKDVGPAVIGLTVTLEEGTTGNTNQSPSPHVPFVFSLNPDHPLYPGETASSSATLINGAWGENIKYTLTIGGMLDSGETFSYAWQPPSGGDYSSAP